MLNKIVSKTKLRMSRKTFDRVVAELEQKEREQIKTRQSKTFRDRMDGMVRKKKFVNGKNVEDELQGVIVDEEKLIEKAADSNIEKVPNFVIMDGIQMDSDEIQFLNIHHKCRELQRMTNIEMEVEISKLATKHRYEKNGARRQPRNTE